MRIAQSDTALVGTLFEGYENMISMYSKPIVLAILMSAASVCSHETYFMCKKVEDIFSSSPTLGHHNHSVKLQGPSGKRGPIGRPQGVVDYERINSTVEAKIHELLFPLTCKVMDGGIFSRGTCFVYHLTSATYNQAKDICLLHKSVLAQIEDIDQQIELQDAIREMIQSGSPDLWTDMKYISLNRTIRYITGRQVKYDRFQWHSGGYPASGVGILLEVYKNYRNHGGFWNSVLSTQSNGALCAKRP